jgi:acyl carrier protein
MRNNLIQILAAKCHVPAESIHDDTDMIGDLGADSLLLAELVSMLEEETGKALPLDELIDVETVGELEAVLERLA